MVLLYSSPVTSQGRPQRPWVSISNLTLPSLFTKSVWVKVLMKVEATTQDPLLSKPALNHMEGSLWLKSQPPQNAHDPTKTVTTLRVSPCRRLPMGLSCRLPFRPFSESHVASCEGEREHERHTDSCTHLAYSPPTWDPESGRGMTSSPVSFPETQSHLKTLGRVTVWQKESPLPPWAHLQLEDLQYI